MSVKILQTIVTPIQLSEAPPEIVKGVQEALGVTVDGIVGAYTLTAFYAFKKQNNLGEINTLGATTARKLIESMVKPVPQSQDDHIKLIIAEAKRQGLNTKQHLAYILATVQHETDGKFKPIDEYASGDAYENRKDLGNTYPGDGRKYKGRGYVQITGRSNYAKYELLTSKPLVRYPYLVKEPYTAAYILVHGFRTGVFTGRKLTDYISFKICDYVNARRCINGLDKCHVIASYANQWEVKVKDYM